MRQAALSPFSLQLPVAPRTTVAIEVFGRQEIARFGVFFTKVGRHRRSVYQQFDGGTILADECRCTVNWGSNIWRAERAFSVTRSWDCPIDQHRVTAPFGVEAA